MCRNIEAHDLYRNIAQTKNIIMKYTSKYDWIYNEYQHIYSNIGYNAKVNDDIKYLYCTDLTDYKFLRNLPVSLQILRINKNNNRFCNNIYDDKILCSHLDNLPVSLDKIEMSKCYEKYKDLIKLPYDTILEYI
jgi:hypothetical protein